MVISDWLEVPHPMKVVLNCATITNGAQSVMMVGIIATLVWHVDRLDSHLMVIQPHSIFHVAIRCCYACYT